jgi:hypothetical protein
MNINRILSADNVIATFMAELLEKKTTLRTDLTPSLLFLIPTGKP